MIWPWLRATPESGPEIRKDYLFRKRRRTHDRQDRTSRSYGVSPNDTSSQCANSRPSSPGAVLAGAHTTRGFFAADRQKDSPTGRELHAHDPLPARDNPSRCTWIAWSWKGTTVLARCTWPLKSD